MNLTISASVVPVNVGSIIDARGMTSIGNAAVALIRKRAGEGRAFTGGDFRPYSTRPIYISRNRGTGARLAPKGGRPSRTGASVFYAGGYAEYKRASTGSGVVNLTLSGQLMRSIAVAKATARAVVVQAGGGTVAYAGAVNDARPFMGIARDELPAIERVATAEVSRHIAREQGATRGR